MATTAMPTGPDTVASPPGADADGLRLRLRQQRLHPARRLGLLHADARGGGRRHGPPLPGAQLPPRRGRVFRARESRRPQRRRARHRSQRAAAAAVLARLSLQPHLPGDECAVGLSSRL